MERVAADAENRCQAVTVKGQCHMAVIPNSTLCPIHNRNANSEKKKNLRNYMLGKYYQRAVELGDSDNVKSLRDEIGLSRMVLERLLGSITSDAELFTHHAVINDSISRVEKLVTSCHKLEHSMGSLMDRSALLAFAGQLVEILASENIDSDTLSNISDKIVELLNESQG